MGANLSYADETGTVSGNINTSIDENSSQSDAKIKQDIQAYIIESYKAQWAKILKDLDVNLQKTIPDKADRQEAYTKIRDSLALRKKRIDSIDTSIIKKEILTAFIDYMIGTINIKIQALNGE